MTWLALAIAVAALVAIGAIESYVSAGEIVDARHAVHLQPGGTLAGVLGLLTSTAVYVAIGVRSAMPSAALRRGIIVGVIAGMVGGAARAAIIGDAVAATVLRSVFVPDWFVGVALAVFVIAATAVSAVAGGALAYLGALVTRSGRSRPPA